MICGDFRTNLLDVAQQCGFEAAVIGAELLVLAGHASCCESSAYGEMENCTCFEAVYDLEQAEPRPGEEPAQQPQMCVDCAYRPGSPEKQGDDGVIGTAGLLEDIAQRGVPFHCHQGVRRVLAYVHTPTGRRFDVTRTDASYDPPARVLTIDGARVERRFKADGAPLDVCAGWAARHRALQAGAR